MREELDFRVEARNTAAVAVTWAGQQRAVGGGASVTLPAVYEELCTEHVLVSEWLDGVSLRAAAQLIEDRGLDRAALSRALLGVDIAAEAHAYAADRVSGQMAPKAVKKTAADELAELLPVIRRLPRRFDRVTGALEQGRLGLNVRLFADERYRQVVTGLTNRFLLAFLGTASGIVAALLLGAAGGPKVAPPSASIR